MKAVNARYRSRFLGRSDRPKAADPVAARKAGARSFVGHDAAPHSALLVFDDRGDRLRNALKDNRRLRADRRKHRELQTRVATILRASKLRFKRITPPAARKFSKGASAIGAAQTLSWAASPEVTRPRAHHRGDRLKRRGNSVPCLATDLL